MNKLEKLTMNFENISGRNLLWTCKNIWFTRSYKQRAVQEEGETDKDYEAKI